MKSKNIPGAVLILSASFLWGTTGTAQALAPTYATPIAIGTIRIIFGSFALLILLRWQGIRLKDYDWPIVPVALSAIGMAAYNLLFFAGVSKTGVAVGTIATIGSSPIIAGLFSWIVHKEALSSRWLISTILAIFGGTLLIIPKESLNIDVGGVLLAISAGASYAIFSIFSKRLVSNSPPLAAISIVTFLGAILLSPLLFFINLTWLNTFGGWGVALHLGIITTAIAYTLYAYGLKTISAAKALTISLAEPLTASVFGILLLGERLTTLSTLGVIFLLIGIFIMSTEKTRSLSKEKPVQ
ncbi:MAG: EamA family transporter [Chloroflexi bacterium]|nr:EamA family transporter [Chloroflexota bacterium]